MEKPKITALGRPVDISYLPNKRMLQIVCFFTALHFAIIQDLVHSMQTGGSIFMVWALNRELDPDHDTAALIAAVFYGGLSFFVPVNASFLTLFWLLLAMRSLSLCVGLPILKSDYILLAVFSLIISRQNEFSITIVLQIFLLLWLILTRKETAAYPALLFSIAGLFWLSQNQIPMANMAWSVTPAYTGIGIATLLFLWIVFQSKAPASMNDQGTSYLMSKDLLSAQLFFVLYLLIVILTGLPQNQDFLLACILSGTLLHAAYRKLFS